ncbi:hypothetical protein QUA30_08440 [Microcoleus sp. Pol14C2]|uniref:hypothetical protein n=1 Tax=unclassified Microcoleus TaxID=2642155 RepID=UPI002FD6C7A6
MAIPQEKMGVAESRSETIAKTPKERSKLRSIIPIFPNAADRTLAQLANSRSTKTNLITKDCQSF